MAGRVLIRPKTLQTFMGNSSPEPTDGSLSVDDIFDALADRRRRKLLCSLRDHDGSLSVTSAAEELAIVHCETSKYCYPDDEIKEIYASLYHDHVPELEDRGLVDYDRQRDQIELTESACYLVPYLTQASKDEMLLS